MGGKKVYKDSINFDTEQEENTKLTEKSLTIELVKNTYLHKPVKYDFVAPLRMLF